jgi:hypothetical protein
MYKAVSSNFRVAFVGSFPKKKCGDGNRCSVGVQGERDVVSYHKWMTSHNFFDKISNTQGWKLAGAQLLKAPENLAGLLEIEVYFSYLR